MQHMSTNLPDDRAPDGVREVLAAELEVHVRREELGRRGVVPGRVRAEPLTLAFLGCSLAHLKKLHAEKVPRFR